MISSLAPYARGIDQIDARIKRMVQQCGSASLRWNGAGGRW